MKAAPDFYNLHVDLIFDCAEQCGFLPTGDYFQLNSYENRVFDLFLEPTADQPKPHVIVKIYRPQRWSRAAIQEEHDFLRQLVAADMTAVTPIELTAGQTIKSFSNMFFSFFPKASGRMPQELDDKDLRAIGRQLAKLHNVGENEWAVNRPTLSVQEFGWDSLAILQKWIAPEVRVRYAKAAGQILDFLDEQVDYDQFIRIHGDCHKGNILQTDPTQGHRQYFFVDFDDFINGLPVQDFWMLLSGTEAESRDEIGSLLSGYDELRHFNAASLKLIPALRGLRIIQYGAWIAKRWQDPTFPHLFPEFRNYVYWAEEVEALEKIAWSL